MIDSLVIAAWNAIDTGTIRKFHIHASFRHDEVVDLDLIRNAESASRLAVAGLRKCLQILSKERAKFLKDQEKEGLAVSRKRIQAKNGNTYASSCPPPSNV